MTQRPDTSSLRRRLSADVRAARYALALAVVVCLAAGTYLTIEDPTELRVKLSGLGINLIAAATFSTIFALLVDKENRSVVERQLDEHFETHSSKMLAAINRLNDAYLPTAVHAPVQGFDPVFNLNLMNDLNRSSYYHFRGPSGKYVAARLRALRRRPDLVRIYVPGPNSVASVKFDIANRSRTGTESTDDVPTLQKRFGEDLLSTIVGLFDCRGYGRIEIFLCEDTLVSRYELTEQHLYTSWYTSLENLRGGKFPETTAFPRSSLHYQAMLADMERRGSFASHALVISPDLEPSEFKMHLESIFGVAYTDEDLANITKSYWVGRSAFLEFLGRL